MSLFPAYVTRGEDQHSSVEEYTPDTTLNLIVGDFGVWDDSNNWLERCGTDPALIAGISEVDSNEAAALVSNGKMPFRLLRAGVILCMSSTTTYVEATHRGQEYGITRSSEGFWQVDVAKVTTDARVVVIDGDAEGRWYVSPLAEFLQFDGIDS
jgi:hypothetical protein